MQNRSNVDVSSGSSAWMDVFGSSSMAGLAGSAKATLALNPQEDSQFEKDLTHIQQRAKKVSGGAAGLPREPTSHGAGREAVRGLALWALREDGGAPRAGGSMHLHVSGRGKAALARRARVHGLPQRLEGVCWVPLPYRAG